MKIKERYILLTILIIIAILFLATIKTKDSSNEVLVNKDIIQVRSFGVNSYSTEMNTSAKGTVFIKGEESIPEHVQIISWIEIDPDDWGGVAFYIPDQWQISNITSSYPENEAQMTSADYVATWSTTDSKYELNTMIEIGRDRSYIQTGGGTGTVMIDLVLDKNVKVQPETFNIMISVGSDEKDGVMIEGPDSIYIEIPIT
ncbi:hypothetical protein AN1V17_51470 [Vallitalea sediminicola]